MFKVFNNLSIRNKLLFYFLSLILISIVTIIILTNFVFSNTLSRTANEATIQAISQANNNTEIIIRNIESTVEIIARQPQILTFLRTAEASYSKEKAINESSVRDYLAGVSENYSEIEGIALVNKDNLFLSNDMYKTINDPLTEEPWYIDAINSKDNLYIMSNPIGRKISKYSQASADETISLIKAIKDPSNNEILGVIVIDMNLSILKNMLKNIKLGKVGFIYIVDSNGRVIYSPINHIVPRVRNEWFLKNNSGDFTKRVLNEQFQFIYTTSPYTSWKMIGVFSLNETLVDIKNFRVFSLVILIIITSLGFGISIVFSSSIAKPISKLRRLMKKAENGDLTVNFDVKHNDEIGQLGKSFNRMIGEIRNLIGKVYEEQNSKRKAELTILQAQIKPHFLYNTLDTIHWMAKKYDAKDISQVVSALTKLFRLGISKGNEIIKISDEIEHIKSYLIIQKIRYEELLEYEIVVEDKIKSLYVQKLILQPIVENAIYHGIKEKGGVGKILIKAEIVNDMIIFTIKDEGVGISIEKLRLLNESINDSNGTKIGYGMFNVNERIRLSYGMKYGVLLRSEEGAGTTVEIRHPIISEERNV